jgi:hypothetical protein
VTGWLSPVVEDPAFTFNTTTGILTIDVAGWYDITAYATLQTTSGIGANAGQIKLQENTGAGYTDIPNTEVFAYAPANLGNTASCRVIRHFNATDTLKMQVDQTNGAGTLAVIGAGTGLTLVEVGT